jgi:2-succinyl-6-hydroxy-2,4-cyclohexadiene-1-carboxylate synthase
VRARLDDVGEPVHLVGYSLGGRLALGAAVAEDESTTGRVASLTLLAASPGIVDTAERAERRRIDAERAGRLERDGLPAFLRRWYRMPIFAPAVDLVGLDLMVARRSRGQAHALAAALRGAGAGMMPDLRPRLPGLAVPVLAIAGDHDAKYVNLERDVAALAPAGEFAVVRGAGHALLVEAPERCAALWSRFVTPSADPEGDDP